MGGSRIAVAALFFANGFGYGSFVAHLPLFKARLALSDGLLGLALLAAAVASLVSMPLTGLAIARFGSARIGVVVALAACASLILPFVAPHYVAFVIAAVSIGAVYSAFDVAINAQAVAVEAGLERPIMSSFHAAFSLGGLMGSALAAVLIARGFPFAAGGFCAAAACFAIALVAVTRLVPEPPVAEGQARAAASGTPNRAVALLGVVAFLGLVGEGAMADWTGVYLRSSLSIAAAGSAAGFGAFSIAMAIGRAAGDRVVAALGPCRTVASGAAVASIALGAALAVHSAYAAYIGFAAVGLGLANVIPVVFTAAGNARGLRPGVGIASVSTLGYVGFVLGPPAIGFTSDAIGIRLALGLVVVCIAAVCFVAPAALQPGGERDFRA